MDSPSPEPKTAATTTAVTPDTSTEQQFITDPREHDVLCGRGGSINAHPGNEYFRQLVEKRKRVYLTARFKREKRLIASSIVSEIASRNGRFLTKAAGGKWREISDDKARDKTSQALRENAPSIRAEIETEINEQRAAERPPLPQPPQHATPAAPGYWGYPPPPPPGGYYPPPPGPPGHPHHHPHHAPPSHHSPPPGYYDHAPPHWGPHGGPPPPGPPPNAPHPHYYDGRPDPYAPKSAFEQTADVVSSGAESLKNWAWGSNAHANASSSSKRKERPMVYVHGRRVKFRDEDYGDHQSRYSTDRYSRHSLMDMDDQPHELQDHHQTPESSMMTQFADRVLGSMGSWEICGNNDGDDEDPRSRYRAPHIPQHMPPQQSSEDDDMAVEWEQGQEVQLMDQHSPRSPEDAPRMQPPSRSTVQSYASSCHSWIPDQISAASSFFGGHRAAEDVATMDNSSLGSMSKLDVGSLPSWDNVRSDGESFGSGRRRE